MKKAYTYDKLVNLMRENGSNLADVAIGRMMIIVEEETGVFPDWSDIAPDWVVANCLK